MIALHSPAIVNVFRIVGCFDKSIGHPIYSSAIVKVFSFSTNKPSIHVTMHLAYSMTFVANYIGQILFW